MIVLSVGMPRAGSGWFYNLTNDLMLWAGAKDAHLIRNKYRLHRVLTEVNCNIGALTLPRLSAVLVPSLLGNTFVIKAHAAPTRTANTFMRLGWMRATYIYRDPRDALLSALEMGKQARSAGRINAFTQLVDLKTGIDFMLQYLTIGEAWMKQKGIFVTRYEDLIENYDDEVIRLLEFLGINAAHHSVAEITNQYRPREIKREQKGLHFRKGKIGRYKQVFTEDQQIQINRAFKHYLVRMGY